MMLRKFDPLGDAQRAWEAAGNSGPVSTEIYEQFLDGMEAAMTPEERAEREAMYAQCKAAMTPAERAFRRERGYE